MGLAMPVSHPHVQLSLSCHSGINMPPPPFRRPTFTEAGQVSHVYPVTSSVRMPPPVTYFSVEVTALMTRVQPSILLLQGPNWGIAWPLTPLHVPFKNSNCTPFTPFSSFWRHAIAPKTQPVAELQNRCQCPSTRVARNFIHPLQANDVSRLAASHPLTNGRFLKLNPGLCTLTRVEIFSIPSFIWWPTS